MTGDTTPGPGGNHINGLDRSLSYKGHYTACILMHPQLVNNYVKQMGNPIARFVARLGNLSKPVMWAVLLGCMVCLGFIDYLTGFEASFALFYLVPVAIAAWFLGQRTGMLFALVSAATWHVSNHLAGEAFSSPLIPYWNASTRLGFFLVVTILLTELREAFEKEKASDV